MKRKIGILSITKATMQTLFNWPDAFFLPTQMNSFVLHTSLFISVQSFLVLLFFLNRCTAMEGCFFKIDYQFDISKEIFINFLIVFGLFHVLLENNTAFQYDEMRWKNTICGIDYYFTAVQSISCISAPYSQLYRFLIGTPYIWYIPMMKLQIKICFY